MTYSIATPNWIISDFTITTFFLARLIITFCLRFLLLAFFHTFNSFNYFRLLC